MTIVKCTAMETMIRLDQTDFDEAFKEFITKKKLKGLTKREISKFFKGQEISFPKMGADNLITIRINNFNPEEK